MQLPGRLSQTTLGDLLGALYRARATGTVELIEASGPSAGRQHWVHLQEGLVQLVETPLSVPKLGDILIEQGLLSGALAQRVRRLAFRSSNKPLGELLIEAGLASPDVVHSALRFQQRLRLEALFSMSEALIRFHVVTNARKRMLAPPLSPQEFLFGRARLRERRTSVHGAASSRPSWFASKASSPRRPSLRREPIRVRAFTTLGLPNGADAEAVRRAFRSLARVTHPDSHPQASSEEKAQLMRRFAELSAAYHALVG